MGRQRDIAREILDRHADYVLALKGNQGTLRADVDLFGAETVTGDHGRIETGTTTVLHDVAWLAERQALPELNGIVVIDNCREIGARIERETRLYVTPLTLTAERLGPIVRSHWAVENSLHWVEAV